jgi:hypothetical protein
MMEQLEMFVKYWNRERLETDVGVLDRIIDHTLFYRLEGGRGKLVNEYEMNNLNGTYNYITEELEIT